MRCHVERMPARRSRSSGTRVVAPSFSAFVDAVLKDDPSVKV
jgi:hypothetical protein